MQYGDFMVKLNNIVFALQLNKFRENRPNNRSSDNRTQLLLMIVHVVAYLIPGFILFLLVKLKMKKKQKHKKKFKEEE